MALGLLVAVATTAIGAVAWVQTLLERQLAPFPAVDRLVWLSKADATGDDRLTVAEFQRMQALDLFDDVGAFADREQSVSIVAPSGPIQMRAATVDYGTLSLLGVSALRLTAANSGLVVSESAARILFAVDKPVTGQHVRVDGTDRTITAVAPSGWRFPFAADLWLPLDLAEPRVRASRAPFLRAIARLPAHGVTSVGVNSALTTIGGARGGRIVAIPLSQVLTDPYRYHLSAIKIAAPLVAIAAVLNGGLLVLARGIRRQRASFTRLALGATYTVATRPLSIEVGLIVAAGSLLGLFAVPTASALALGTVLDGTIGAATSLVLALTAGIVSAAITAIIAARWLRRTAAATTWGADGGRVIAPHKTTGLLVIGQLAVALLVCFVATAVSAHVRKFERLKLLPQGLDAVTMSVSLRQSRYPTAAAAADFFGRVVTQLEQSPDILQATYASRLPGVANPSIESLYIDRQIEPRVPRARVTLVGSDFFGVTGIQRIAGREFSTEELMNPRRRPAIVVDAVASTRLFGTDVDPIGQRVSLGTANSTAYEVIGVVRNVREPELDPAAAPEVYLPAPAVASGYLLIQTRRQDVSAAVREALWRIDPEQAVGHTITLRQAITDASSPIRARAQVLWFLVITCVIIVNVGVAGLVGSSIAAREREFGVRMVLGRSRRALVGDTVGSLVGQAALAVVLAVAMGGALWPAVSSTLPGTTPWDTVGVGGTGGLIVLVVLGTGWLAASISLMNNPADLLRR